MTSPPSGRTTGSPFPTYAPTLGSALYTLLVEAEDRAAFSVHCGTSWGDISTSWVRFLSRGHIGEMEATPVTPSEMMTELLSAPPVGMEDPHEVFLHALSTPVTIVSFSSMPTSTDNGCDGKEHSTPK